MKIVQILLIRNHEIVTFGNEGSQKVLHYAFPQLKKVYLSGKPITGNEAEKWDSIYGLNEQCLVLDSLYKNLSLKSLKKLGKMARGKGWFRFGVPKSLTYEGKIDDCSDRFKHGMNKILPYYLELEKNNLPQPISSN